MENSTILQIRSMLRHGLAGMVKFIVPGLALAIISLVVLKPGVRRDLALRISIVLPFIGFLWGLRVYEYSSRFSHWKKYLIGKATLEQAFISIANKKIWIYMIIAAYFCGIVIGAIFFFLVLFKQKMLGGFHVTSFSFITFMFWIPACAVLLLFGANLFGPKPDDEEELALEVVKILNKSPRISPMEVASPSAIERFVAGATTEKGLDVKPYLWILSHIRPPQAMAVFRSSLKNSDAAVRQIAVTYLSRTGGGDALQLLQEHLRDESDPEVRQLTENSLSKLAEGEND